MSDMSNSYLQTMWDDLLVSSFFSENNANTMHDLVTSFHQDLIKNQHISSDDIFTLGFKRFPFNEQNHLACQPIRFICGFLPELAQLLWKNADTPIEELLSIIAVISTDTQKDDAESNHQSLNFVQRQKNRSDVGRNIIALNKKLNEHKSIGLNWIAKK